MIIRLVSKERVNPAIEILPSFFKERFVLVRVIIKTPGVLSSQMTGYFHYRVLSLLFYKRHTNYDKTILLYIVSTNGSQALKSEHIRGGSQALN